MKPDQYALYARQEFLTPGESETLDVVGRVCRLAPGARVLEVASGKGEAACLLSVRHGWRVFGADRYAPFVEHAARKVRDRQLGERVSFALADGRRLPVSDGCFDAIFCFGGPSIVGMEPFLEEAARVLTPGSWLAISDWVWRKRPVPPEALPLRVKEDNFPVLDEFAAMVRSAGFEVLLAQALPSSAWEEYYGPMLETLAELRREHPDDPEVEEYVRKSWENEPRTFYERGGREYWGYAVLIARKL